MANSALGSQSIALLQLPSGMLIDFAGTVEPVGWLMCDGRAVSRATFSSLFASIGTAYGVGDGSTTFNLPDFRGRFARYNDNMGTAQGAASRDTGRAHGSAQTQATAKNGLANASSTVTGTVGGSDGLHNHGQTFYKNSTDSGAHVPMATGNATINPAGVTISNSGSGHGHGHSLTASAQTITGDAETRPINLACNKLIKI